MRRPKGDNINKFVQLPALYLDQSIEIKDQIITLVKKYEKEYKTFLSTSSICQRPNFNRDCFASNIDEIYKYFDNKISIDEITTLLIKLNDNYSKADHPKANLKLKKNAKYNFWLFLDERIITCFHIKILSIQKNLISNLKF
jgi:hypothetical protein